MKANMVKIERARVEEAQEIKQVLSETWVDTYGPFLSQETIRKVTSAWHDPKLLASQIKDPGIFFGVAKDENDRILGLVTARKRDTDTVVIFRLYVHPQHQRKGIGSRLLEEAALAFSGARRIQLEIEEQNHKGLAFYLKQGFTEIGRKEERVEDEVLKVIEMEKRLT